MSGSKPTAADVSNDGSLIENLGTPPEVKDGGGEVSPDVVDALLESEVQFYELGEDGFRSVDETMHPVDEGEAPEETEDADDESAADEVEEESGTADAAQAEETEEAQEEESGEDVTEDPTPVQFKADGQEFVVEGSHVDEDGNYVIPADVFARKVQPHLADRRIWAEERQGLQKQIAALDPANNPTIKQAEVMLTKVNELLSDEDALDTFVAEFEKNRDKLVADAEKAKIQQELDNLRAEKNSVATEQADVDLSSQMALGIERIVEMAMERPEYEGLDEQYVSELLTDMQGSIYFRATEANEEAGLEVGDIGVDYNVVARVLQREAKRVENSAARRKAQRKNSAASTRKKSPTTPAPKADEAQVSERPKTKAEWEARLRTLGG
jgi:hypothetical protein